MPIKDYGVWKATPVSYTYETKEQDSVSPHLSLIFSDDEPGNARAAINIKSGDHSDSRLVYWAAPNFKHPITQQLSSLQPGFAPLDDAGAGSIALDFIRGNLFQRQSGRILPHDIPGANNDILDVLKPILDRSIKDDATIYLYGSHFNDGKGIHNVHMNQGSPRRWSRDNGVYHDGALLIQFNDHWEGIFIAFASQAVHTNDGPSRPGQPIPPTGYLTWANFLDSETPEDDRNTHEIVDRPVVITEALVNPIGPDNQPGGAPETVTLTNRSASVIDLSHWTVRNKSNESQTLPDGAQLGAGESKTFEVPGAPLSNKGGIITLLNAQGLKVHGVSYTKDQARKEGVAISFA
ncbi:uncharacterized protein BDR25DRAFT_324103 [Lindgomyces ingoldianus]|uniref:Uncharacterized protein n=1 Tax=Lindgomyces ingoldianus TaxID=673940 RepID=A0ACB6R0C7_9PLEO|nr:uncharacterized protein BDR25DRAFT_324103 [Lindgomyces ingoldianus]KAF2472774.1 hypothetical protein BDR25DRAFT_324103 [Lindgomyces ingoldianus]